MSIVLVAARKAGHLLSVGVVLFALIWVIFPSVMDLADSRWSRDVRHVTPFRDVVVLETKATEFTLEVSGYLVKDRDCEALGRPDVLIDTGDRVLDQGFFDQALVPPGTPASLAASPMPRRFSGWVLVSRTPWPKAAIMLRTHLCPDSVNIQTNKVLTVPWKTSNERQIQ